MDKYCLPLGKIAIAAGVLIILWLLLPSAAWWFLAGVMLIVLGIKCCRKNRKRMR